jgi:hypothetical protein
VPAAAPSGQALNDFGQSRAGPGSERGEAEVAITAESGADRFCLIDYINDQCAGTRRGIRNSARLKHLRREFAIGWRDLSGRRKWAYHPPAHNIFLAPGNGEQQQMREEFLRKDEGHALEPARLFL